MSDTEFKLKILDILSEITQVLYPKEDHGERLKSDIESLRFWLYHEGGDDD